MTDVILGLTTSVSTSVANVIVTWIKNGGTPVVKSHSVGPNFNYQFRYLTDAGTGAVTAPGDIISATVAEVDSVGNSSVVVASTPASVTIPIAPPLPPTSVTLALA